MTPKCMTANDLLVRILLAQQFGDDESEKEAKEALSTHQESCEACKSSKPVQVEAATEA